MKKIVLCCNGRFSTSLLVQKMEKVAAARGMDIQIQALGLTDALSHAGEADAILLGPQISYALDDFKKKASTPAKVISMTDYGRMNAEKIIDDLAQMIGGSDD